MYYLLLETVTETYETNLSEPDPKILVNLAKNMRGELSLVSINIYDYFENKTLLENLKEPHHIAQMQLECRKTKKTRKSDEPHSGTVEFYVAESKESKSNPEFRTISIDTLYVNRDNRNKGFAKQLLKTVRMIADYLAETTKDIVIVEARGIKRFEVNDDLFKNQNIYSIDTLIPSKRDNGSEPDTWLFEIFKERVLVQ